MVVIEQTPGIVKDLAKSVVSLDKWWWTVWGEWTKRRENLEIFASYFY